MTKGTHSYLEDKRNKQIKIYVNGKVVPRSDASISVFDSGFLLGDGVWEGIRLLNGKLVFLDEHLNRLFFGAKKLEIDIGYSPEELTKIIYKTLKANNMNNGVHIRLIISRGLKKTPYQHPNANFKGSTLVIIPEYKKADQTINKKPTRWNSLKANFKDALPKDGLMENVLNLILKNNFFFDLVLNYYYHMFFFHF